MNVSRMKFSWCCLAKKWVVLVLLAGPFFSNTLGAQFFINGDVVTIQVGAKLVIKDSLRVKKAGLLDAKIENNGKIVLGGDMNMQPGTQITGNGNFCFTGASFQSLKMNGIPLPRLEILNNDSVVLADDLTITDSLKLGNGHLILGSHDLVVDSTVALSGGSSSSYIRLNGTGRVKATVGSSPFTIPVGRNPYLPVIIDNGDGAEFSVGVSENIYANPVTQTTPQTSNVVGETWSIQASSAQNNVSITLQWEASEEETGFNRAVSYLSYWEEGVTTAWDVGSQSAAAGSGPYTQTRTVNFTTNQFYFGVGGNGSALPVDLTYFNAEWVVSTPLNQEVGPLSDYQTNTEQNRSESALLTWQTTTEINNSHFEIQRAYSTVANAEQTSPTDGQGQFSWATIGRVEGYGTSHSIHTYQFTDPNPFLTQDQNQLTVYYRFKQIDFNGQFQYSPIRALSSEELRATLTEDFSVSPNPVKQNGTLHLSVKGTYFVYSSMGKRVMVVNESNRLNVGILATGTYLIKNAHGNCSRFMVK